LSDVFWKDTKKFIHHEHSEYASDKQGGQKINHCQIIVKKLYWKSANEIRFICKIKVSIKHYSIIRWY